MFDNPEKLFILLVIALLIFGPSKLASLGGTMGRAIRDFRNSVRGAQDTFSEAKEAFHQELAESGEAFSRPDPAPPALPQPEPIVAPATPDMRPEAAGASEYEGPDSLVSEPSAEAVREMPGWKPSSE